MRIRLTLLVVLTLLALTLGLTTASAHDPVFGVVPASVEATVAPGNFIVVNKTVHTLPIPPVVDICLVEDETGSFGDDIANLQALAGPGGPLITALDATGANYTTCVIGYRDFAQNGWGSAGDWVYRRLADVSAGGGGFIVGVPLLSAGGGGDGPEAQLEALHYLADPAHLAIDSNGNASTADVNDTAAGLQPTWRVGSTRVALLATDADCHITGDAGGWPGDGGTTSAAVTGGILDTAGITVIGLTPGGAGTNGCVDTLAAATGGTVHPTTATGAEVGNAIMAGLGNLPVVVNPSIGACDADLTVTFDVPSQGVTSGDDAVFVETITVGAGAAQGQTLDCTVDWLVDGVSPGPEFVEQITIHVPGISLDPATDTNEAGSSHTVTATVSAAGAPLPGTPVSFTVTAGPNAGEASDPGECSVDPNCSTDGAGQVSWTYLGALAVGSDTIQACFTFEGVELCDTATKDWVDTTAPVAACLEGVNPAGHVPRAPGKGQNEDGFYELTAEDLVDPDPQIFVTDTESGTVFGPFPSGTNIKLVQAPGAEPNIKPGPGEVDWIITLNGDAAVTAVDDSGNVSAAAVCLVPPPPK